MAFAKCIGHADRDAYGEREARHQSQTRVGDQHPEPQLHVQPGEPDLIEYAQAP